MSLEAPAVIYTAPGTPDAPAAPPSPAANSPQNVGAVFTAPGTPDAPVVPPSPASNVPQAVGTVMTGSPYGELTTALATANANVRWTGFVGGSVTYAAPAAQTATGVEVSGIDVTVTPGTKARMHLGGLAALLSPDNLLVTPTLRNSKAQWTSDGLASDATRGTDVAYSLLFNSGSAWIVTSYQMKAQPGGGEVQTLVLTAQSTTNGASPEGLTYAVVLGSGDLTVAAAVSSAQQCIDAVAASAASILTGELATGNDGTGAVGEMAKSYLVLTAPAAPPAAPSNSPQATGAVFTAPSTPSAPVAPPAATAASPQNVGAVFTAPSTPAAPPNIH